MSATTTQLLSSGEFCKLRYDSIPVESAPANVSFYTSNSKIPKLLDVTLLSQMSDILRTIKRKEGRLTALAAPCVGNAL